MFFNQERQHFFRPLSSKYREHIAQCLSHIYKKQFSDNADYGVLLERNHVLDAFEEVLIRLPSALQSKPEDEDAAIKTPRDLAYYIFKQLVECGWIEKKVDPGLLETHYIFSQTGRLFCQSLIHATTGNTRTRHRNPRNTVNSLEAFHRKKEAHDLVDAYGFSERIISDFTDVIAELEEQKRALTKEVESNQLLHHATDHFFDFMEKRFKPDISVRLSADSVEKHRDDIMAVIEKIKTLPKTEKHATELELRRIIPNLTDSHDSFLWYVLNHITKRMQNASEIMLPALRQALHGFTRRADIIIRQLNHMRDNKADDYIDVCRELKSLPDDEQNSRFIAASNALSQCQLHFIDPSHIKISEQKQRSRIDSALISQPELDPEAQRQQFITQQIEQMYQYNQGKLKQFIDKVLIHQTSEISTDDITIETPSDLIMRSHIIELAQVLSANSPSYEITFEAKNNTSSTFFEQSDTFKIKKITP